MNEAIPEIPENIIGYACHWRPANDFEVDESGLVSAMPNIPDIKKHLRRYTLWKSAGRYYLQIKPDNAGWRKFAFWRRVNHLDQNELIRLIEKNRKILDRDFRVEVVPLKTMFELKFHKLKEKRPIYAKKTGVNLPKSIPSNAAFFQLPDMPQAIIDPAADPEKDNGTS